MAWTLRLDSALLRIEQRLSRFGTGMTLAIVCYALALLSITPTNSTLAVNPINTHSSGYAHLSQDPFDTSHPLIGRVLTPAVAHYLGVRGERFVYMPLAVGLVFLALVYTHFRQQDAAPSLAVMALASMALSSVITMMFHLGGFPDTTSFALLLLAFMRLNTPWWGVPFALALLNHENGLVYLPAFLMLAYFASRDRSLSGRLARTVVPGVLSLVVLVGWRSLLASTAAYSADGMYLNARNISEQLEHVLYIPLGMFMSFKLLWIIPLVAVSIAASRRHFHPAIVMLAILGPTMATLLLASDSSRLASFAFLAILYGIGVLRRYFDDQQLAHAMAAIVVANVLVPTYHVWSTFMSFSPPAPVGYVLSRQGIDYFRSDSGVAPIFREWLRRTRPVKLERVSQFLPEGSPWDHPNAFVLSDGLRVTLPSPGVVVYAVSVQADANDSYIVRCFWGRIEVDWLEVPPSPDGPGLRTRDTDACGMRIDSIVIEPGTGDGAFSVSALKIR